MERLREVVQDIAAAKVSVYVGRLNVIYFSWGSSDGVYASLAYVYT